MKKLLTLFLLLSIIVTAQAWKAKKKETPTPAILKKYPFTMSNEDIYKTVKNGKWQPIGRKTYFCVPDKILGYDAKLCFLTQKHSSNSNTRGIMFHIPLKKEKNPREYVKQFSKIKRLLTKKYGSSTSNKSDYNKNVSKWRLKKYKKKMDGKELALNDGVLEYVSTWEKDKFIIELKCSKEINKSVCIDLSYIAPKVKPAVKVASNAKKADPLAEL